MARRKTQKDYEQFSKKLSKWVLIFWAVYRILTLAVAIIRPDVTQGLTALTTGVDDAAMCVVISYTVNSATEKVAINYFTAKADIAKALGEKDEKESSEGDENG